VQCVLAVNVYGEKWLSIGFTVQQVSVLKLLRSVNQVREEYENLRREISEVQQLQKQLSDSLRLQLRQVQGTFGTLRDKIIGGSHQNN
jgi:hypothetical protein